MNNQPKNFLLAFGLASALTTIHYASHKLVNSTPFSAHPIAFVGIVVFIVSFTTLMFWRK